MSVVQMDVDRSAINQHTRT